MILADHEIRVLSTTKENSLVSPFEEDNLRKSSYDLTVGDEYYIGDYEGQGPIKTTKLRRGQTFFIPPHAVAFVICEERIYLKENLSAKVSLRMAHIYKGAILTTQPPFDPGYLGKVILLVHNLSSEAIYFQRGERIATMEFYKLNSNPKSKKAQSSVVSIEKQLSRPLYSSLDSISKTSKESLEKIKVFIRGSYTFGIAALGVLITFIGVMVALMGIPAWKSTYSIEDDLKKQSVLLKEQAIVIEKQNVSIKDLESKSVYLKDTIRSLENAINDIEKRLRIEK